jgi:rare lipoprotein A
MGPRIFRLALTLGLLAGLSACVTPPGTLPAAPAPPASPAATAAPSSRYAITAPPSQAAFGDALDASLSQTLPGDRTAPALLGGETPKEFQRGQASWYGPRFNGRRTASGERFNMNEYTAAHRSLPFGTLVRVHSLVNGRDVDVRITDRGPYSGNRIIDVSRAAADELGMLGLGFKEVVLLVPESVADLSPAPPLRAPVRKRVRNPKRPAR